MIRPPPHQCLECIRLGRCGLAAAHCRNQLGAWGQDREIPICALFTEKGDEDMSQEIVYESVESGHIDAIGHDGESTMMVRYKAGTEYAFHGISCAEFENIKNSASVGRAINACGTKGVLV